MTAFPICGLEFKEKKKRITELEKLIRQFPEPTEREGYGKGSPPFFVLFSFGFQNVSGPSFSSMFLPLDLGKRCQSFSQEHI